MERDKSVQGKDFMTTRQSESKPPIYCRPAALLLTLILVLCATNRWLSFEDGIRIENAVDTNYYMSIAASAPALPPADAQLSFHHAQRFVLPYIVGTVAFYSHLSPQQVFRVAAIVLIALITCVAYRIFCCLCIPLQYRTLCISLLILHPYMFRLYLAIPALANDLMFTLGLSLLVYGLLQGKLGTAVIAALIASLGKQTILFALPVTAIWILLGPSWSQHSLVRRTGFFLLIAAVCAACYLATASVAKEFSQESIGASAVLTGLPRWVLSRFNAGSLANFLFRGIFPFLFPLCIGCALLFRTRPSLPKEFYLLIAMVLACCLQPLMGGPIITGPNFLRLNLLAYVPLLAALGLVLREAKSRVFSEPLMLVCGSLIAIGSLHPRLTYNGQASKDAAGVLMMGTHESFLAVQFVCLYCLSALLLGVLTYLSATPAKE